MGVGNIFRSSKPKGRQTIQVKGDQDQVREEKKPQVINVKPATDLLCQSRDIELFIKNWMESMGWMYEDFTDILEQAGLIMPVQLSSLLQNSFLCYDNKNKDQYEFNIELCGPQHIFIRRTNLTEEELEITRLYFVEENKRKGDPEVKPEIEEKTVIYKWRNRSLEKEPFGHWNVKISDTDAPKRLEVKISAYEGDQTEVKNKQSQINGYLLYNVEPGKVVTTHKDICRILGTLADMSVTLFEKTDEGEVILKEYKTSDGKMDEYTVSKEGETYYFYANGSWECKDFKGQKIVCIPNKGYGIELRGTDSTMITEISEIANHISSTSNVAQQLWSNLLAEQRK